MRRREEDSVSAWTRRAALAWLVAAAVSLSACEHGMHKKPQPTVLFDEGHGQRFLVEERGKLDLSGLAAAFQEQGAQVKTSREEITDAVLSGVDALVVSGPFAPFTPTEIETITRFLSRGKRLSVMLHIPHPVAPLMHRLDVAFSNGVIRERANVIGGDPLNFHVTTLTAHALTTKVEAFDTFGAWALMNDGANAAIIARTSPTAWVDL